MNHEKKKVALLSVGAAIFLTGSKLIIGVITGSLGILSEALHSALDLVAAIITYFAVRISDKPGDKHHHFGHGKVENLSALIETALLIITCIWIIYEAVERILTGNLKIEVTVMSYVVICGSIIIDYWRSRALSKVAKKYNSQALEADALHFSTDIWSSLVVLLGLLCSNFGYYYADTIAALGVAMIVTTVSYRLGLRSINVLLDRAPDKITPQIEQLLSLQKSILGFQNLRVREGGATVFTNFTIKVDPELSIGKAHAIADDIEAEIRSAFPKSEITIHIEPAEITAYENAQKEQNINL
jgi:cation diffusion facilitator family transporter